MVQVYIQKFFSQLMQMILFEGGLSFLGGSVRPHSSHIPKTTTGVANGSPPVHRFFVAVLPRR